MTIHPDDNTLALFASGRLREEEEDALESHLSDCGACRARLESIERKGSKTDSFLGEIKMAASLRLPDELYEGCILRNQFHLEKKLGSGGIGVVWKAYEEHVHRSVVLKFVKMNTDRVTQSTNNFREMFRKVQMLQHTNICPLYDMFDDDRHGLYLVMKYIEGETLEAYRRRKGPLPLEEVVRILWPVAQGLDYAHLRHVIHRDIKPQNIVISDKGDGVQIIDFDLADTFGDSLTSSTAIPSVRISGTRPFMAPEQWQGQLHVQTDQYALAVTAYELLSGSLPFVGNDIEVLCQAVLHAPAAPIPNLPDYVNRVLLRGLAKKPSERFATCCDFISALSTFRLDTNAPPDTQPSVESGKKDNKSSFFYFYGLVGLVAAALFSLLVAFYIVLPGTIGKTTRQPVPPKPVDTVSNVNTSPPFNTSQPTTPSQSANIPGHADTPRNSVPSMEKPSPQESIALKLPRRNALFRTIRFSLSIDEQGIIEFNIRNGLSSDPPESIRGTPFPFDAFRGAIGLHDPNGRGGRVLFPLGLVSPKTTGPDRMPVQDNMLARLPIACGWRCSVSEMEIQGSGYSRFSERPNTTHSAMDDRPPNNVLSAMNPLPAINFNPALSLGKEQKLPLVFTFDVINNVSEDIPDFGIMLRSTDRQSGGTHKMTTIACSGRRLPNGNLVFYGGILPVTFPPLSNARATAFRDVELSPTGSVFQRLVLPDRIAGGVTNVEYYLDLHDGMFSGTAHRTGFSLTFLDISGQFTPSIGISRESSLDELSMENITKCLSGFFFPPSAEKIVGINGTSDKGEIKKLLDSLQFGDPVTINLVSLGASANKRDITIHAQ